MDSIVRGAIEHEKQFEARKPDYKSDGVAVWIELDKNNNKYLNIHILGGQKKGGLTLVAFENTREDQIERKSVV